ncbi:MAG: hypothetical protein WBG70_19310 [Spirulinaceae cyanobacterium]
MSLQCIQQTIRQEIKTREVQRESITERIFKLYLQGLKNGKNKEDKQYETLFNKIDSTAHWKQRLDSSHSKEMWLKKLERIAEKLEFQITKKESKALEKVVCQLNHNWGEHWERGRIWA